MPQTKRPFRLEKIWSAKLKLSDIDKRGSDRYNVCEHSWDKQRELADLRRIFSTSLPAVEGEGSHLVFYAPGWERDVLVPLAAAPGGKVWTWVYADTVVRDEAVLRHGARLPDAGGHLRPHPA